MEYDLLELRRHPHPLLFEREGKCNGVCSKCWEPLLRKPSFRCSESDCNFQIHQSCIHLPQQIHSPFHPQHPLSLKSTSEDCYVCGETNPFKECYKCDEYCRFGIDIKCAIAKEELCETSNGKYVHITHPQHPLTLALSPPLEQPQQNGGEVKSLVYYCVICEQPIQSGSSTYFCSECDDGDGHFHKQCAELPIQKKIPEHPHPLSLRKDFNSNPPWLNFICDHYNKRCHICRNECRGFKYSCLECKFFDLHIPCLQSFYHKHNFIKLHFIIEFICRVCGEESKDRSVFLCNICHMLVHKECVECPLTLRIYEHHHDLTHFKYFSNDYVRYCKICGIKIDYLYAGYGCSKCKYFSHFKCAQRRRVVPQSTTVVAAEKESIEQHFNILHPHKLVVFPPEEIDNVEYKVCDGCMKCLSASGPSYGCRECDFYLHEECAELPTKIETRIIHKHVLTLISTHNFIFECHACSQRFHGFAYRCETCSLTFDIRCASLQISFLHPNHQHPLFLYDPKSSSDFNNARDPCDACGKKIGDQKLEFRCAEPYCEYHLDLRCATLPVQVRYRFNPRPLYLTFFEEDGKEEYVCDICEDEERELWEGFYSCRKSSFEAHQMCVVGEFPFVKSAMHKYHRHPLNMVTMKDPGRRACGACNTEFCSLDLVFQCRACKFDVHATGRCYDLQLSKRNLVFTNYNVFSRANEPYDQSIQKIHCIRFQYSKKGKLVWSSKHGKEEGTKHEVSFDYPDEYLVQIRGNYGLSKGLTSLSIETNRKTYGPFGFHVEFIRKTFRSENRENITGIFGTTNEDGALHSIGFHYISTNDE